jgi:hypothetical protein
MKYNAAHGFLRLLLFVAAILDAKIGIGKGRVRSEAALLRRVCHSGARKARTRNLEIPGSMPSGRASRGPVCIAPE